MDASNATLSSNASIDSSDDEMLVGNDFYCSKPHSAAPEPLTEAEERFVEQIKADEMPHVQHFFSSKKVKNLILAELRYVTKGKVKEEQTYEVEKPFAEPFFVMSFEVDDTERMDPSHGHRDNVAFPVPSFEVVLVMLKEKASELRGRRTATRTADEALRYVFFRLWSTVPPGILVRLLFFAGLALFGSHAALRFASVRIVRDSLVSYFGKSSRAPGATLPIEQETAGKKAVAAYFPHIRSIARKQWRANGDDNSMFDAHFKPTSSYNLDEAGILRVIGQPFDIWNERSTFDDDLCESLLVELDVFREEYKTKLRAEKPELVRDRKPFGLTRRVRAVQTSAARGNPRARLIIMKQRAEQDKTMAVSEKTRLVGGGRTSQAPPTFAKPFPNNTAYPGPGPSSSAARHQDSAMMRRQEDDDLASVPASISGTPVGSFARPSSVRTDHDYAGRANTNAELMRLRQELQDKTDQLEICEREKQGLAADNLQLANDLGMMRDRAEQLEADIDRLTKESQEGPEQLKKAQEKAEQLKGNVKHLEMLVEEKVRDAEESAKSSAREAANIESLKERLRLSREELDAVKSVKEALHEANVLLEAKNAELNRELKKAKDLIDTVEQENRFHENENSALVDQIRAHMRESAKLKADLAQLRREKAEMAQKAPGSGPQIASNDNARMKRSASDSNRVPPASSPPKRSRDDVNSAEDRRPPAHAKPHRCPSQTNNKDGGFRRPFNALLDRLRNEFERPRKARSGD